MTKEETEKLLEQEPCTCDTAAVAMGPHYHLDGGQISRKRLQAMLALRPSAPVGWQCPGCNACYAPYVQGCYRCGPKITTEAVTGTTDPPPQHNT